jgi:UDP-2,3-diacylglucosamine pyrophosphatase LpxH
MKGHNLLVVSDLHLCEGFDPESGKFSRMEDFLFDDAFARFLRYHEEVKTQPRFGGHPWLLIFNGDLFDFLQVIALPEEGRLMRLVKGVEWRRELSINERDYGLGTTAAESEWKLQRIARGHQGFFAALGWFVAHGNQIAVLKGNHDIELHWPQVWERFVLEIERAYTRERLRLDCGPSITSDEIKARLHFYPWFYCELGRVYVEHGGQYEAASYYPDYLNPVMPDDPEHIQLPWGSLFVRYLFNKVEDVHPFADNVKPPTRYLAWAFRRDPIKTVKLLVTRGWVFLRAFWNVAHKTVAVALQQLQQREQAGQPGPIPLPPEVAAQIKDLARRRLDASWREWAGSVVRGLPTLLIILLVILAGVMLLARLWWGAAVCLVVAACVGLVRHVLSRRFRDTLDDYLVRAARQLEQVLKPTHAVRYIVMGHDHCVALERLEQAWYVNTGAWVQVFWKEGPIEGREFLTFFRLPWGYEGTPEVLHWDDAAGAPARVKFGLDV